MRILSCTVITLSMLCLGMTGSYAQKSHLDIPSLHQLVNQSQSEYELQVQARGRQAVNTANEQANLTLLERVKQRYRQLQERYQTLGSLVSAANIGIYAAPMVSRIVNNQAMVLEMVRKNPALIAIGYESQLQFAAQAQSLIAYVTALSISFGDVNQMRASDRKVLFDFVLAELSRIQDLSGNMLRTMQYADAAGVIRAVNPFRDFIDADISIGKEIIQNAKYLK
ncbi:deoxyadenosine/deoxycytidine kinase [Mucilaginibacter terrae]|uniref:Deoxyadenosine/deoxycytidine kinase n=2 Tax=Mucilaginibacter terrae TaxID=1955052 RepID=A0ABU3GNC1_9SPHI|nr:deoxyadenosine/deoxycytidine kinase [Mucilaginibacter terrae]